MINRLNLFLGETEEGKLRKLLLSPLCLLSFFYGLLVRMRVLLYDLGFFRSFSLPCKVVSVGNITLGGTGKTPFVLMLAEWFQSKGIPTAILSRGYKGSFRGPFGVVSNGNEILMDVRQAGDEPHLLSLRLKGVPVLIGKERRLSGREAVDKFQARVVILDDGFQHLPLKRDLNLLLADARRPFGNGWLFPRGTLREPPDQVKRSDAVILTKADLSGNIEILKEKMIGLAPRSPIFSVRYAPVGIRDRSQERNLAPEALRGKRILPFTGIGNPDSFRRLLENLGAQVMDFISFGDHYWYHPEDLRKLLHDGEQRGAEALVTTEKDSVRIQAFPQGKIPLWVLSVQHEFLGGEQKHFEEFLWRRLELGKKG